MQILQSNGRPVSAVSQQRDIGDIGRAFANSTTYNNPISRANSVPFYLIFDKYNVQFVMNSAKTCCPLPDHKGERTPSFYYYKETNTFHCFGCTAGSRPTDFVSKIDNISPAEAADKILISFEGVSSDNLLIFENNTERLKILLTFSESVLKFRKTYFNAKSSIFVEELSKIYDDLIAKHGLSNKALSELTKVLKLKLQNFQD